MDKDSKAYLKDILNCINRIEQHVTGIKSIKEFEENYLVLDAVLRRLAIIGEALNKASKLNIKIQVSNQNKIIALRHIIVHDYDKVDENVIWPIIKVYLPVLEKEIQNILIGLH